jgi:hypothetical protein
MKIHHLPISPWITCPSSNVYIKREEKNGEMPAQIKQLMAQEVVSHHRN